MPDNSDWLEQHANGERLLADALEKYFLDQTDRVATAIGGYASPSTIAIAEVFREHDELESLLAIVEGPIVKMMATGASNVLALRPSTDKAFGLEKFKLPARVVSAIVSAFGELIKQTFWTDIVKSTATKLTDLLRGGIDDGLSGSELSKKIRTEFTEISKVRSESIARTETTGAYNAGHQAAYDELAADGIVAGKKWLSIEDEDTRASHEKLNGVIVRADELFDVGGSMAPYPGHFSLPPEQRCNCRCVTVADFGDLLE